VASAAEATPRKGKKSSKSGLRLFASPEPRVARQALAQVAAGTGL
jgi:hypothetical protein